MTVVLAISVAVIFFMILAVWLIFNTIKGLQIVDFILRAKNMLTTDSVEGIDVNARTRITEHQQMRKSSDYMQEVAEAAKTPTPYAQPSAPNVQAQQLPTPPMPPQAPANNIPASMPPNITPDAAMSPQNPYQQQLAPPHEQRPQLMTDTQTFMNPLVEDDTIDASVVPTQQAMPPPNQPAQSMTDTQTFMNSLVEDDTSNEPIISAQQVNAQAAELQDLKPLEDDDVYVPPKADKFDYGVRHASNSPGRIVRDKRYERNSAD